MYRLENRYQDSGWELLSDKFYSVDMAIQTAKKYAKDAICYGMVRVINIQKQEVIVTFPAGCPHDPMY